MLKKQTRKLKLCKMSYFINVNMDCIEKNNIHCITVKIIFLLLYHYIIRYINNINVFTRKEHIKFFEKQYFSIKLTNKDE